MNHDDFDEGDILPVDPQKDPPRLPREEDILRPLTPTRANYFHEYGNTY